jgi:hypothetical protein
MTSALLIGAFVVFIGALLRAIDLALDQIWGKEPKRKGRR